MSALALLIAIYWIAPKSRESKILVSSSISIDPTRQKLNISLANDSLLLVNLDVNPDNLDGFIYTLDPDGCYKRLTTPDYDRRLLHGASGAKRVVLAPGERLSWVIGLKSLIDANGNPYSIDLNKTKFIFCDIDASIVSDDNIFREILNHIKKIQ